LLGLRGVLLLDAREALLLDAGGSLLLDAGGSLLLDAGRSFLLDAGRSLLLCTGEALLLCTGGSLLLCTGGSLLLCTGEALLLCTGEALLLCAGGSLLLGAGDTLLLGAERVGARLGGTLREGGALGLQPGLGGALGLDLRAGPRHHEGRCAADGAHHLAVVVPGTDGSPGGHGRLRWDRGDGRHRRHRARVGAARGDLAHGVGVVVGSGTQRVLFDPCALDLRLGRHAAVGEVGQRADDRHLLTRKRGRCAA
jgi:hypothetical protein